MAGALLFGAASVLQLHAQAAGIRLPSQMLSAPPYLVTILALVMLSLRERRAPWGRPAPSARPSRRTGETKALSMRIEAEHPDGVAPKNVLHGDRGNGQRLEPTHIFHQRAKGIGGAEQHALREE